MKYLEIKLKLNKLFPFVKIMENKSTSAYNTSIPADLQDILIKLKFLSMIERGTKVNVNTMNFVRANSILGAVYRAYNHENRRSTYQFVKDIVDLSIETIGKYKHPILLERLIKALRSARVGIKELSSTYHDDPEMVSRIDVLLEKIDLQLKTFAHILTPDELKDDTNFGDNTQTETGNAADATDTDATDSPDPNNV